jgi:hypothetical protein
VSAVRAVSIVSGGRFIRIVSVPPRWPAPDWRTLTSTLPPETATPWGRLPTLIGRAPFDAANAVALVCGPELMMEAVAEICHAAGA